MGDFWAFFRSRELPLHMLPAFPLQLRFLQLENYGFRSFCQLALRLSARFYASEEAKPRTWKPREVTS
ncbi:hypothetical protein SLEP1_g18919 [Rubroshorea leprosula]|uniref:Uncharacterized protein n=1 Tax=Rubroshorea leprosula TaxID=152421 RepID=A0AAV5IZ29_9ROSI|nr:hypothetical protein SLEP1_g18919 [Rubroshorea leprosula]